MSSLLGLFKALIYIVYYLIKRENIMKKTKFILLIILLLFLNGCKDSATEAETKELLNTLWTLESFEIDGEVIQSPIDQIYNIQFFADSTMKGLSDCNEIGGKFKIFNNNQIEIFEFRTTEIYCGSGMLDDNYTVAIREVKSFIIDEKMLVLNSSKNVTLNLIGE